MLRHDVHQKMKRLIQMSVVTAAHLALTVGVSLGAWAAQEGASPTTTASALLRVFIPISYAFNFPIPVLLRDNSLLIMLCNSMLFGAVVVALWTRFRKTRNKSVS